MFPKQYDIIASANYAKLFYYLDYMIIILSQKFIFPLFHTLKRVNVSSQSVRVSSHNSHVHSVDSVSCDFTCFRYVEVFWHLAKQRLNAKLKKQAREERERLEGKIIDNDDRQEKKPFNMYEDE